MIPPSFETFHIRSILTLKDEAVSLSGVRTKTELFQDLYRRVVRRIVLSLTDIEKPLSDFFQVAPSPCILNSAQMAS